MRIRAGYWKPSFDYLSEIIRRVDGKIRDGDILVMSEKALSTALGRIVDEEKVNAKPPAKIIAAFWMRLVWGYFLGYICRLKPSTIKRLRNYPKTEGAKHKQLALQNFGFLQALRFGSEGGIDTSNLPYSYVSLPPPEPENAAREIHELLLSRINRNVTVLIVDSDKSYSLRGLHLSPTRTTVKGIHCKGGVLLYAFGRFLKFKPRSTPIAVYPKGSLAVEETLNIAEKTHHIMGHGAGKTAWDAAEKFNVPFTGVSWEMLESIRHYPLTIVRR